MIEVQQLRFKDNTVLIECPQCNYKYHISKFQYLENSGCCMTMKVCVNCFVFNNTKKGIIHGLKINKITYGIDVDYESLITDEIVNLKLLLRKIDTLHVIRLGMRSKLNTINADSSVINKHILKNN